MAWEEPKNIQTFEEWVAEDPDNRDPSKWERIVDDRGYVRFVWKGDA